MSNIEIENPVHIKRIAAGETEGGDKVINLFSPPLKYAVLQLFSHQWYMLSEAGIDPDQVLAGQDKHPSILAHWEPSERTNKNGVPYKDVRRLEPKGPAGDLTQLTDQLMQQIAQLNQNIDTLRHKLHQTRTDKRMKALEEMLHFLVLQAGGVEQSKAEASGVTPPTEKDQSYTPKKHDKVWVKGKKKTVPGVITHIAPNGNVSVGMGKLGSHTVRESRILGKVEV